VGWLAGVVKMQNFSQATGFAQFCGSGTFLGVLLIRNARSVMFAGATDGRRRTSNELTKAFIPNERKVRFSWSSVFL
jgi:hypothetical protein